MSWERHRRNRFPRATPRHGSAQRGIRRNPVGAATVGAENVGARPLGSGFDGRGSDLRGSDGLRWFGQTFLEDAAMAKCEVCGNDYDKSFSITMAGRKHTFD